MFKNSGFGTLTEGERRNKILNEKDYQYTLTIAKCKSFSRAAELLYISQPALSRYISALEKELGVTLFDRSTNPIQLTNAGKRFCSYADAILELESTLRCELREGAPLSGKTIKVGVPLLTGEYILSRILPRIMKKYPHLQIDPIQDISDNLCQRLAAHQIDAAFVCTPVADSSICSEILFLEDLYLVGHREHPALADYDTANADLDHPLILDLSTLKGVSLIHCKPIAIISYLTEGALKNQKFKPEMEIKASSLPLALDLTSQGVGFTGVMRCQIKYGHPSIIQALCPISLDDCKLPFYLAYNSLSRRTIPELDIFLKEVFEEYQAAPYI